MSTVAASRAAALGGQDPIWNAFRAELHKLMAQLTLRLLAVLCVAAPFAFALLLKIQSGTPSDALLGAWVHSSGFAISLVILGFAGNWGFPLIAGLVGGDLFASEDRHGTWKTVLTRSCTRRDLFAGKLLAAGALAASLAALLGLSSLAAGLLLAGAHSMVDLSGVLTPVGRLLAVTVLGWLLALLPVLAYTSVAVLVSIATRNGIVGLLAPLLLALATQLLDLVGHGVLVHMLLIGSAFDGWHGLLSTHRFYGPLIVASLVSVAWIVACLAAGWLLIRRRDFLASAVGSRAGWGAPVRAAAIAIGAIAVLALLGNAGPTGVTQKRLTAAVGEDFNNLTLLQQQLLGRRAPAGAKLDIVPYCNRRAAAPVGPGDWSCTVYVYLPQQRAVAFQQTSVEYDVSVQYNGCFKAQSPPAFIGGPTMQALRGRSVTNPLYVVYGCFDTL